MYRPAAFRREEHRHDTSAAALSIEGAQRSEAHALQELDDLAHGLHLVAGHGHGETMKCSQFRGDA